jgi:hypothetical protein
MGLAERQFIANLKEKRVPYHQKNLAEVVGREIAIDVAWDTIENDGEALKFIESTGIEPAAVALRKIARKPLGKEAISEAIDTLRIVHSADPAAKSVTLEQGVLTVTAAYVKDFDGRYSENDLEKTFEALL